MLPAGKVGQRSDVPWSLVGPGWLLATWAPTAEQQSADITMPNPPGTALFLVDPLGGRYALSAGVSVPDGDLVAWSGDGKRALFQVRFGGRANVELSVLDLANGSKTSFSVATTGAFPTFTKPSGLAIFTRSGDGVPARRLDLTGAVQLTFPTSYEQSGGVRGGSYSPGGTEVAFDTSGAGIALVTNDGRLLRYLPIPVSGLCTTLRWWSATKILVVCGSSAQPSLWLVPSDGQRPSLLGPGGDAWQLSTGTYSLTGRCHMDVCSFGLLQLGPDGASTPVTVPAQWTSNAIDALGGSDNRLAIFAPPITPTGIGTQAGYLYWFDPHTDAVTPLLGGSVNGGSVNAALSY